MCFLTLSVPVAGTWWEWGMESERVQGLQGLHQLLPERQAFCLGLSCKIQTIRLFRACIVVDKFKGNTAVEVTEDCWNRAVCFTFLALRFLILVTFSANLDHIWATAAGGRVLSSLFTTMYSVCGCLVEDFNTARWNYQNEHETTSQNKMWNTDPFLVMTSTPQMPNINSDPDF